MKKYTIEDLRNGLCAVEYNLGDSLTDLQELLIKAFPNDDLKPCGGSNYYYASSTHNGRWWFDWDNSLRLPVQPLKDFLEPEFKRGDRVLVSQDNSAWFKRTFITTIEGSRCPYICIGQYQEEKLNNGQPFDITLWPYIKPLEDKPEITEYTIEDISKLTGTPAHLIRIKK